MAAPDETEGLDETEAKAQRALDEMERQLTELRGVIGQVFEDGKVARDG